MNKRNFLKATGITFVASLLASPFIGRNESSCASAQEGESLEEQISKLRKALETEIRTRQNWQKEHEKSQNETTEEFQSQMEFLSKSFVGTVVAFPEDKQRIPEGWLLCDGGEVPAGDEFDKLRDLIGNKLPDYQGYFLRGLDGGKGRDEEPNRKIGSEQGSANLSHNHDCSAAGNHTHGITKDGSAHRHTFPRNTGYKRDACDSGHDKDRMDDGASEPLLTNVDGQHTHGCASAGNHGHGIGNRGGKESRPINVAVNYIIKYK